MEAPAPAPMMDTNSSNVTTTTASAVLSSPAVKLEMSMTVANPAAFVADAATNEPIMVTAVAAIAEVEEADVSVDLRVGEAGRRLLRRLQDGGDASGTVIVDATIEVADANAGAALETLLGEVTAEMMTNHTLAAFDEAGIDTSALGLEVTGFTTEVLLPLPPSTGESNGATLGHKASNLAPFLAVSAWVLSHF